MYKLCRATPPLRWASRINYNSKLYNNQLNQTRNSFNISNSSVRVSGSGTSRTLTTSTRLLASFPPNRGSGSGNVGGGGGGGGGGGERGGFPIGNIFGKQEREPGAALKEHGVDLCELARAGKLSPVIGRDEEIKRTIQVLSRRTKNNPLLIGEAGVGKTAIIEGLAARLVSGEIPESLVGKRIISLDLSSIMSNTGIRGSFEEKMKNLLADIEDDKSCIVFIDEVHQILNLGKTEGSLDFGNLLKPALARGLQLVSATTLDEFRKTIEKDAALTRRFQTILVEEPTVEQTISILRGLKRTYEVHHGITISDSALVTAAVYSNRYITDRHLPDKALDLVDDAASALKLARESKPEELEITERTLLTSQIELTSLKADSDEVSVERVAVLTKQVDELKEKKDELEALWRFERRRTEDIKNLRAEVERKNLELAEARRAGNFEKASQLLYLDIPSLKTKLDEMDSEEIGFGANRVTSDDIAKVVSKATGIPVSSLIKSDRSRLLSLESVLRQKVIGQDPAISAVAAAIRLSRAGLNVPTRPIASFLFLGNSGVGKTELAKALSEEITSSSKNLVVVNMSEYSEKHTVSRLIGAAPGYVGYEDSGAFTDAIRKKPFSVVLLDEFEKAHRPEVPNIFLQVLDEGTLTDGHGRKVDFKNTILILTSNIGSDILAEPGATLADGTVSPQAKAAVLARVQSLYPPELLNRLDEQIVFNSLAPTTMNKIVSLRLEEVAKSLSDRRISLLVENGAREWLAETGYSPIYGARSIKRIISKSVRRPLATAILQGTIRNGDTARVRLNQAGDSLEVVELHQAEVGNVEEVV